MESVESGSRNWNDNRSLEADLQVWSSSAQWSGLGGEQKKWEKARAKDDDTGGSLKRGG